LLSRSKGGRTTEYQCSKQLLPLRRNFNSTHK